MLPTLDCVTYYGLPFCLCGPGGPTKPYLLVFYHCVERWMLLCLLETRDKRTLQLSKTCFTLYRSPVAEKPRLCTMAALGWNLESTTFSRKEEQTNKQTSQGDWRRLRQLCYQLAWDGRAENWNREHILAKLFSDSRNRRWAKPQQAGETELQLFSQSVQTPAFSEDITRAGLAVTPQDWFLSW